MHVLCRRVGGYIFFYVEARNIFSFRDWNNDAKREVFLQRQNVAELFLCWRKRCLGFWSQHRYPSACHLIWTLDTLGTHCSVSTGCSSSGLNSRDTDVEKQRWVGKVQRDRGRDRQTDKPTDQDRDMEGGWENRIKEIWALIYHQTVFWELLISLNAHLYRITCWIW